MATAPASARSPISPTVGSSLAVRGRASLRPEVPTGCSGWLAVVEGAGVAGAGAAVGAGSVGVGVAGAVEAGGCAGSGGVAVGAVVVDAVVVAVDDVVLVLADVVDCGSVLAVTRVTSPFFQLSMSVASVSTAETDSPDARAIIIACAFGYTNSLPLFSPA